VQAYAAVATKLKDADPHAADELAALRNAIATATDSNQLGALVQAYAAVATKLKDADLYATNELAALRNAITRVTDSDQLGALAQAYAAVATDADPHTIDVLAALRYAITTTTYSFKLSPLAQAYAAVATKFKDADTHAADELAALRNAITRATDSDQLRALAQAYAAVAKAARSTATPENDIAVLLSRMPMLRAREDCEAFAAALKEATRLGRMPLRWEKVGLVYAAALLEPVCAGEPARRMVADYEEFIHQQLDAPNLAASWSGDVWAFVAWARVNLPGLDPHQPRVDFLSRVAQAGGR
jgi:hypothetical protein